MPQTRPLTFELVNSVLLLIHSDQEPTPRDWDEFLELYDASIMSLRGLVVYTPGPGPDAERRRRIAAINAKRAAPVAVVTPSRIARGMVTALSWFGVNIKAFEPGRLADAFAFAGVSAASRASVEKAFDALFRSVFTTVSSTSAKS